LLSYVRDSQNPRPAYLAAAKVAQAQGANDRRDHYLALAHRSDGDDVAVQVMKAELQLDNGQWEEALASLVRLRGMFPKNVHVVVLLATIYERVKDWEALSEILPELRKRRALSYDRMAEMEMRAYEGKLDDAFGSKDSVALHNTWNRIPKTMHTNEVLLTRYLRYMISRGEYAMAEPFVRATLKRRWNEKMVYLYGLLIVDNPTKALGWMEHFLDTNENNPVLLHTLGSLAMQAQLWGKARTYLETAAERGGEPESYFNLAKLLDEVEEPDAASECYRKGLSLASKQRQQLVLQADMLPA
jgi:HemY protein